MVGYVFFDEKFIRELDENPLIGVDKICNQFKKLDEEIVSKKPPKSNPIEHRGNFFTDYVKAYALLKQYNELKNLGYEVKPIKESKDSTITKIVATFNSVREQNAQSINEQFLSQAEEEYSMILGQFHYKIPEKKLKRIQDLINELRDLIDKSEDFEEEHKRRILIKLEKLQSELNKRVSNVAFIYGQMIQLGLTLGKFGEASKPFFDRIKEILSITVNVQKEAEGLPDSIPNLLESGDD